MTEPGHGRARSPQSGVWPEAYDRARQLVAAADWYERLELSFPLSPHTADLLALVFFAQARELDCRPFEVPLAGTSCRLMQHQLCQYLDMMLTGTVAEADWTTFLFSFAIPDPDLDGARQGATSVVDLQRLADRGGAQLGDRVRVLPDWGHEFRPSRTGRLTEVIWPWTPEATQLGDKPRFVAWLDEPWPPEHWTGERNLLLQSAPPARQLVQAARCAAADVDLARFLIEHDHDEPQHVRELLGRRVAYFDAYPVLARHLTDVLARMDPTPSHQWTPLLCETSNRISTLLSLTPQS